VNKNDLDAMAAQMISASAGNQKKVDTQSLVFDFGKPNVDFEKQTIEIKFHVSGKTISNIDLAAIKSEILGKNEADLTAYLSTFSDIEKAEISYWPSFVIWRIPFRSAQVEVALEKN
jgi:hypothetical protein